MSKMHLYQIDNIERNSGVLADVIRFTLTEGFRNNKIYNY